MSDEKLTCADFEPYLGSGFTIADQDVPMMTLTLKAAKPINTHQQIEGLRAPFALLFEAPAPLLPQRLYAFDHDAMGRQVIFVVPIAKTADGFQYEAVFN